MKRVWLVLLFSLVACGKNNGRTPSIENTGVPTAVGDTDGDGVEDNTDFPSDTQGDVEQDPNDPTETTDNDNPNEPTDPSDDSEESISYPLATNVKLFSESCFLGKVTANSPTYVKMELQFLENGVAHSKVEIFKDASCSKSKGKENHNFKYDIVKTYGDVFLLKLVGYFGKDDFSWIAVKNVENGLVANLNANWNWSGIHLQEPSSDSMLAFEKQSEEVGIYFTK